MNLDRRLTAIYSSPKWLWLIVGLATPPIQNSTGSFTWSSNTMQVRLSILREVKVDDYVDSLDVNSSSEEICWKAIIRRRSHRGQYLRPVLTCESMQLIKLTGAHQVSAQSVSEVVEHTVSVFLKTNMTRETVNQICMQQSSFLSLLLW